MRRFLTRLLLSIALVAPSAAQAQSTSTTILSLPQAGPLTGSEVIPLDQGSANPLLPVATKQASLAVVQAYMVAHQPPLIGDCVTSAGAAVTSCLIKLNHAINASNLSIDTNYSTPTMRDDVGVVYTDTGASCTIPGGDFGWQIQPAVGHCWQTDISKPTSVKVWGANSNNLTDNLQWWQPAVNAMAANGGGTLTLPATNTAAGQCYAFSSTSAGLLIPADNIAIVGDPSGTCINPLNPTGNGFYVGGSTSAVHYFDTVRNIVFVPSVPHTAGAMVEMFQVYGFNVENVHCSGVGTNIHNQCVGLDYNTTFGSLTAVTTTGAGQSAIEIGCNGGPVVAGVAIDGKDDTLNYQNRAGIELCNVSGVQIDNVNTDFNLHGLWAHPGTGQTVDAMILGAKNFFDLSGAESILLDSSGGTGTITDPNIVGGMWVASSGSSSGTAGSTRQPNAGYTATGNATASCVQIKGNTANANTFIDTKINAHVFNCGGGGISVTGATAINALDLSGTITGSGVNCGAACVGLFIDANISHWSWNGRIGGASRVSPNGSTHQNYGIVIGAGTGDYVTIAGDLTGNVTGTISDNSASTHKNFKGVLPIAPWLPYAVTVASTTGTLTAATGTLKFDGYGGGTTTFAGAVNITTNGTGAGQLSLTLPFSPVNTSVVTALNSTTGAQLQGVINAGDAHVYLTTPAGAYPGANSSAYVVSGSYQPSIP